MIRPQTILNVTLVIASLAGAVLAVSCNPTGGSTAKDATPAVAAEWTLEEKLAEGKRLVAITGCNDCHTPGALYGAPDMARELAGSEVGWVTPAGTAYASNLTPDVETGAGRWSEEELATILRTGHRPDGTPLLPPMPWQNTTHLTDREMRALVAYLKSLPPVKHKVPAALPPGVAATSGPSIVIPAPGAWDAPTGAVAAPGNQ